MSGNRLSLTNAPIVTLPDMIGPVVSIEQPLNGTRAAVGAGLDVVVRAFDPGGVASLAFSLNGQPVPAARLTADQFVLTLPVTPGRYELRAIALDAAGNRGVSAPVEVIAEVEAIARAVSLFVAEGGAGQEAVSRAVSLFIGDEPDSHLKEAVSRAVSLAVTSTDDELLKESISRPVSLFVPDEPAGREAVSRAVSLSVE
jgi:hypothetical protein